jgi:hypothetical protein
VLWEDGWVSDDDRRFVMVEDAEGFVLHTTFVLKADEQDYLDGASLRRLREALPADATIGIEWKLLRFETHGHGEETASFIEVGTERAAGTGATVAEAADACREAVGKA